MFKPKFIISLTLLIIFLLTTSAIKNKTRVIEKQISNLNKIMLIKEKNINEAELDFYYLTSPVELEKKINLIGLNNYQPIKYSNIYLKISDYNLIHNKISNLDNLNGKKIQKK
tara:strand:- start:452 stop:790 length:339 start_codon:yes stop_codon:yes gene_type:complete